MTAVLILGSGITSHIKQKLSTIKFTLNILGMMDTHIVLITEIISLMSFYAHFKKVQLLYANYILTGCWKRMKIFVSKIPKVPHKDLYSIISSQ